MSNGIPFGVGRRFAAELLHGEVDGRGKIRAVGHVADPEHDLIRALRIRALRAGHRLTCAVFTSSMNTIDVPRSASATTIAMPDYDFSDSGRGRGEVVEQPECLGAGGDAKLIPQRFDAHAVLAAYQLLFMLRSITPHE